jgi:sugar phosphate isomerase/epimerase
MQLPRRSLLAACAGAVPAITLGSTPTVDKGSGALGLVIHSFPVHQLADRASKTDKPLADPLRFVSHCLSLGVRSIQIGLGVRDSAYISALRAKLEAASAHLEGIVALPREQADLDRFEAEIRTAENAGVSIVRTVTMSGRRYETFDTAANFQKFAGQALNSLNLAARVVSRSKILLAVENHKDWRADELLGMLKKVGCEQIGICLDTGNSIALLEDPMEVVETLAPKALTSHFKDMAVEEYREGFLLSEVPLGTGMLDLTRIVQILHKARTEIRFNIEMITRDPLRVPCLTERYWATFPDLPGRNLAHALTLVRAHVPKHPLPRISPLAREEQIRIEDDNVQRCLTFAQDRLGL